MAHTWRTVTAARQKRTSAGIHPKSDVVFALMVDGTVRPMKKTMSEATWRALTTYAGGELVAPD